MLCHSAHDPQLASSRHKTGAHTHTQQGVWRKATPTLLSSYNSTILLLVTVGTYQALLTCEISSQLGTYRRKQTYVFRFRSKTFSGIREILDFIPKTQRGWIYCNHNRILLVLSKYRALSLSAFYSFEQNLQWGQSPMAEHQWSMPRA